MIKPAFNLDPDTGRSPLEQALLQQRMKALFAKRPAKTFGGGLSSMAGSIASGMMGTGGKGFSDAYDPMSLYALGGFY